MTPIQYKDFVQSLIHSGLSMDFLNSDEDKMKIVYMEMLNNSKSEFRIFAGTLTCDVTNSPEFVETLSDYIERDGELHILLNAYNEEAVMQSQLFKRLAYYKSQNRKIVVKVCNEHPYIEMQGEHIDVHFAIGDKMSYRIETDIKKRTAICNMNNPQKAEEFAAFFDSMFQKQESKEINLVGLFKMQ